VACCSARCWRYRAATASRDTFCILGQHAMLGQLHVASACKHRHLAPKIDLKLMVPDLQSLGFAKYTCNPHGKVKAAYGFLNGMKAQRTCRQCGRRRCPRAAETAAWRGGRVGTARAAAPAAPPPCARPPGSPAAPSTLPGTGKVRFRVRVRVWSRFGLRLGLGLRSRTGAGFGG